MGGPAHHADGAQEMAGEACWDHLRVFRVGVAWCGYPAPHPSPPQVFRVYSNNHEYEMSRLGDTLSTVPNDTRIVVKLGRALKPGEFRVKLFLLRIREPEVGRGQGQGGWS